MSSESQASAGRSSTPLVDAVRQARAENRHPLQIPGHKYRYSQEVDAVGYELLHDFVRDDMPLQGGADNLAGTNRLVEQAEALYAAAIDATHTRFSIGGSSQANIAALLTISSPGRRVAVDRTSHRSVLAGLVLSGAVPEWIFPMVHPEFGLPVGVSPSSVSAIDVDVTAVFVTSPSYVGTISDIARLSDATHDLGVALMTDQAWGAHLDYLPGRGALANGADMAVTSIHKALMGYSATAIVSTRGDRVDTHRLDRALDLVATTSPSATLFASIDATREVMMTDGVTAMYRAIDAVEHARAILRAVPGLVVIDDDTAGCAVDPLKLTLWLPRTGVTGTMLNDALWELGISVESADSDSLIMTISPIDDPVWVTQMADLLVKLIERHRGEARKPTPIATWQVRPDVAMTPRDAMFSPRRRIALGDAVGEVSAEQFCPYPPGVPLVGPGERVTAELVEAIRIAGTLGRVAYCSDPTLATIEVVDG